MNLIKEIRVFVSCPGDVTQEKDLVKKCCDSLQNAYHNTNTPVRFHVQDWRNIVGDFDRRPQEIINSVFKDYDIYLGILWKRFGSTTGGVNEDGKIYQSGTEEEFDEAIKKKQFNDRVKVYFFFKELSADENAAGDSQIELVKSFKAKISSISFVNIINYIIEPDDFIFKVNQLLTEFVKVNFFEKSLGFKASLDKEALEKVTSFLREQALLLTSKIKSHYIPRSLTNLRTSAAEFDFYFDKKPVVRLRELLKSNKLISLLGNAGSGKSMELFNLALNYSKADDLYFPIYVKCNKYNNEKIDDFLPNIWKVIPVQNCLFLMDGLDEIKREFFNNFLENLNEFYVTHPDVTIVISSRLNFYNNPEVNGLETLPGFQVFSINDFDLSEVEHYATAFLNKSGKTFIDEAFRENYNDLLPRPFFLNILLEVYQAEGHLKGGRAGIYKQFIDLQIHSDKNRFKSSLEVSTFKNELVYLLQRIALIMEITGNNYISTEDLKKISETEDNLSLLIYFPLFTKSTQYPDQWYFEHNNIQEYFAAIALKEKPATEIKQFITIPPDYSIINPSWVNTLSFLISIINKEVSKQLIDYLIEAQPEVIIKFEQDRVDENIRLIVIQWIFEDCKLKNIWLRSNRFTDREFAKFSNFTAGFDFLYNQLNDNENSILIKYNALSVIEHFSNISLYQKGILKEAIFKFIETPSITPSYLHYGLYALGQLGINDIKTVQKALIDFGERTNEYVRSGLYKLINSSGSVDNNIQYYLDGVLLLQSTGDPDRSDTSLLDEAFALERGLLLLSSFAAIKTFWEFIFKNERIISSYHFHDFNKVIETIVEKCVTLSRTSPEMYELVFKALQVFGKFQNDKPCKILISFFEKTNSQETVFLDISEKIEKDYIKYYLLALLLNEHLLNKIFEKHAKEEISKEFLLSLHEALFYHSGVQIQPDIIELFESKLVEKAGFERKRASQQYGTSAKEDRFQKDFDLLFDVQSFKKEVTATLNQLSKTEFSQVDINSIRAIRNKDTDITVSVSVIRFLNTILPNGGMVTKAYANSILQNDHVLKNILIDQIYNSFNNRKTLKVNDPQKIFLSDWCTSVMLQMKDKEFYFQNYPIIWSFFDWFDLDLPADLLLNYTVWPYLTSPDVNNPFIKIEEKVGKQKLQEKVLENINKGLNSEGAWKNNFIYAIYHRIASIYPNLVKGLSNKEIHENYRKEVFEYYVQTNADFIICQEVLTKLDINDSFAWTLINNQINRSEAITELLDLLNARLFDPNVSPENQLQAAKFLIQLNQISGLEYVGEKVLKEQNSENSSVALQHLNMIKSIKALPTLFKLLDYSVSDAFESIDFTRLYQNVINAFFSIGLSSLENLNVVTNELKKFVDNHPQCSYINALIDNMVFQYSLIKSKSITISEALQNVNSFLPAKKSELNKVRNIKIKEEREKYKKNAVRRWRMKTWMVLGSFIVVFILSVSILFILNDFSYNKVIVSFKKIKETPFFLGYSVFLAMGGSVSVGYFLLQYPNKSNLSKFEERVEYPADLALLPEQV